MEKVTFINQLRNIIDMLFSPSKVFNEINKTPYWLTAYLFIAVGTIFIRLLYLPFLKRASLSMFSEPSVEQSNAIAQSVKSLTLVSASLSPLYLILKFFIITIILWFIVQLFTFETDFKKNFSLIVHCGIITFLASFLKLIILHLREIDSIKSTAEIQISLGIDIFLKNLDLSLPFKTFLSNINLFSVWWIVLLASGISITSKISRTKSTFIAVFLWIFGTAIQVGVVYLTHLYF